MTNKRREYPYTIENGAGEQLTFARRVSEPSGDRLEVENLVSPRAGPPMHVHYHQEEALTVIEGRIGFQRPGGPARFAEPGETVVFPAGEAHKFWNAEEGELRCAGYIKPAGTWSTFLEPFSRCRGVTGGEVRRRPRAGGALDGGDRRAFSCTRKAAKG